MLSATLKTNPEEIEAFRIKAIELELFILTRPGKNIIHVFDREAADKVMSELPDDFVSQRLHELIAMESATPEGNAHAN